jgi:hypothetical protein
LEGCSRRDGFLNGFSTPGSLIISAGSSQLNPPAYSRRTLVVDDRSDVLDDDDDANFAFLEETTHTNDDADDDEEGGLNERADPTRRRRARTSRYRSVMVQRWVRRVRTSELRLFPTTLLDQ